MKPAESLIVTCRLSGLFLMSVAAASAAEPVDWLTGVELRRQLERPIDLAWSGVPTREALESLSRTQRVAVVLDRRLDPSRPLKMALDRQLPLRLALDAAAAALDTGVCMLGPVAVFGPTRTTHRVPTVAALRVQDVRKLPAARQQQLLEPKAWHWDDLATPRELIEQLAAEAKLRVEGLERVPHDLWAAVDLPPLSVVDRLSLVAAQFDLTFWLDETGTSIKLQPMPDKVALVRSYPGGSRPELTARRFAELAPESEVTIQGNEVVVRGRWEDHQRLTTEPRQPAAGQPTVGSTVYTLSIDNVPLEQLLDVLKKKQIDIRVDQAALERAGISLAERISLSVERATLDELLQAALEPVGLKFKRRGNVVEIAPDLKP